jgi:hypothetical protein
MSRIFNRWFAILLLLSEQFVGVDVWKESDWQRRNV